MDKILIIDFGQEKIYEFSHIKKWHQYKFNMLDFVILVKIIF